LSIRIWVRGNGRWYACLMRDQMYYTYIVASRSHNFYVGMTSDIEGRVWQHKNGVFEGYSKKYNCNRLVWFERFPFVQDAIAREKQLKGWSRVKKIALIERENPAWVDLSEEWGKPVKMFEEG
jgi:putative endonuclease